MGIYVITLADVLRAAGVPVVECDGWETRGSNYHGGQKDVAGIIDHHTATPDTFGGDMPTLRWLLEGGPSLPPPVANHGLGRSGTWYVVAAGRANHSGPVYPHLWTTFGNGHSLGTEAENSGVSGPWPEEQYASYARGTAAQSVYYDVPFTGHKIVRPGKVDPSFDWDDFAAEVEEQKRILRAHGFAKGKLPATPVSMTATTTRVGTYETPDGDDPAYLAFGDEHPKVAEVQEYMIHRWPWAEAILVPVGAADGKYGGGMRTAISILQRRLNRQAAREDWRPWTDLAVDGKWGPATEAAVTTFSQFRRQDDPDPEPTKEAPTVTPTPYEAFPIARSREDLQDIRFGLALEQRATSMGFKVTCGPSDQQAGRCAHGRHPHSRTSWHFRPSEGRPGWALDVSRNYGGPVSEREIAYLSSWVYLVQTLYGHLGMDSRLNVQAGDHDDHAHTQPAPHITEETIFLDFGGAPAGVLLPGMGTVAGNRFRADEVRTLQRSLGVEADGVYGIQTFDAVRAAQSQAGITVDGIAGPATTKAVTR